MKKTKFIYAFTLLEAIVALFALSFIAFSFQTSVHLLHHISTRSFPKTHEEFQTFLFLLQFETKAFTFQKEEHHRLYFTNEKKERCVIERKGSTIIKSYNKGYHPLLTEIKTFEIQAQKGGCKIEVTFLNGQKEEGFFFYPT